jgi:hypothetical protein
MYRRSIAVGLVALLVLLAASVAQASITSDIIEPQHDPATAADGWQSGSCTADQTNPPPPATPKPCSPETPELFFKQAGGHPPSAFTLFVVRHPEPKELVPGKFFSIPEAFIKDIRVELPVGLSINPESLPRCPLTKFNPPYGEECELMGSTVGTENLTLSLLKDPTTGNPLPGLLLDPSKATGTQVPNYNLEPNFGEPALFGFIAGKAQRVFFETDVAWDTDYHASFIIKDIHDAAESGSATVISRLVNNGRAGADETFISNPTTCLSKDHYVTLFGIDSHETPDPAGPPKLPNSGRLASDPESPTGCENVPFDPSIHVAPGTNQVDSPAPVTVTTELPYNTGGDSISESHLKNATVVMPKGLGINPSGSKGLVACTDAQFHKGERVNQNECPAASVIGTAEIDTPPLPAGALKGKIYVGEQKSTDPTSGEEFRALIEAESERYGIHVRLIANVKADPATGQLTAEIRENPQVPFESVKLKFDGSKSVLSTPPTCAAAKTTSTMEPWSTPLSTKSPSDEFTLTADPGGGACPQNLAQRRFAPAYTAASDTMAAGSFSPFRVHIGRGDGEQELKQVDALLPKGLSGKLAGVPYCPEAAIAAAGAKAGKAEQANPSCPAASMVGSTSTASGTGPDPVQLPGKVYLAGPYKGAPISLAVITPAVQGPFDLGTVVVRVALNVNPITAQIRAVSDVIPDVYGGVKLDLRSVDFNMDRSQFTVNPTNCEPGATAGSLAGGGADPTDAAKFSAYGFNVPYQTTDCGKLGFKPRLKVKLFGPTTRAHFPRLQATLRARPGDANIGRTALTLPHALFLEQGHIGTVCTNPKLASHTCPADSVYGQAEAVSPLLAEPLKGAVYLVPSGHELPDLVADLQGQVEVQLHGTVSSKRGGLRTVFESVPDVPVTKFVLNMRGGRKSLLVNSTNTCKHPQRAVLSIKGQNGKSVTNNKFPLDIVSCRKHKKGHKHHR